MGIDKKCEWRLIGHRPAHNPACFNSDRTTLLLYFGRFHPTLLLERRELIIDISMVKMIKFLNKSNLKTIRAIVLSYDRNHIFVDHMIQKYEKLWPENPFIFKVPYNNKYPSYLKEKYGSKIELIRTPSKIKDTVLKLIEDIREEEWIYWCIDDKYVDKLLLNHYKVLTNWILSIDDPKIQGVSLARARGLFDEEKLDHNNVIETPTGGKLITRRYYNQFWLHQFFRVKVIKTLFESFPDKEFRAKEMDGFIKGKVAKDGEFYVYETNLVVFGESASRGKITKNAIKSLKKEKLKIPDGILSNRSKKRLKIGRIKILEKIRDVFMKPEFKQ